MKKVVAKLLIPLTAGEATQKAPVGPALAGYGLNVTSFCGDYNRATADRRGQSVPAEVTVYEDSSYGLSLR